jgi:hypothetical protein
MSYRRQYVRFGEIGLAVWLAPPFARAMQAYQAVHSLGFTPEGRRFTLE